MNALLLVLGGVGFCVGVLGLAVLVASKILDDILG